MLAIEEFDKVEMRVGTITAVKLNKRARVPAYGLKIDLGEMGVKSSSAQITDLYSAEELVGRQVVVVTNFAPIRIADVKSEVRVLGADDPRGCVLLSPERAVPNGSRIF